MSIFSKFEGRMEDTVEEAANKMFDSPISPVQIAKKAEKQMRREKMVGAGKQYAPTLFTILVNAEDDKRLFGYYPTLAGETETYLNAKAVDEGLVMDGPPLVRFIVDEGLKRGKFEIIAELVASPIVNQLRAEEMDRYGISKGNSYRNVVNSVIGQSKRPQSVSASSHHAESYAPVSSEQIKPSLPYVPEDEIDYSIDYGEYTFDSRNFDNGQEGTAGSDLSYQEPVFRSTNNSHLAQERVFMPMNDGAALSFGGAEVQKAVSAMGSPHNQQPDGKQNTVVFTSGAGNAQPIPHRFLVQASLMDTDTNRVYDLATKRLLLGRDKKSDLVVDDINASRAHAELRFDSQGVWVISDLGSTNGTFVNGVGVSSQILNDGDYLTIGTTNYLFVQTP